MAYSHKWFPSATGRVQDREVRRPKDRRYTTVPRNQPTRNSASQTNQASAVLYSYIPLDYRPICGPGIAVSRSRVFVCVDNNFQLKI